MIVDLSSPIELRGYELLYGDNGVTRATLQLFNISEKTISEYSCIVHWSKDGTSESVNDTITVDALSIPQGSMFRLSISTKAINEANRVEVYFTGTKFDDGSEWSPKDGAVVDISASSENDEELIPSLGTINKTDLKLLRDAAGEDAIMYPETQDKFWRCVCGRINTLETEECDRCKRRREYVLKELNFKSVHLSKKGKQKRKAQQKLSKRCSSHSVEAQKSMKTEIILVIVMTVLFLFGALAICLKLR